MLLRPLRRREDRIARPARVRIRRRKPCTLWRRRLFGWYVRLLTRDLRGSAWSGSGGTGHLLVDLFDRHRPPAWMRRGHAAPVDSGSTAQRYGLAGRRVKPTSNRATLRGGRGAGKHVPTRGPGGQILHGLWRTACYPRRRVVSVRASRVPHGARLPRARRTRRRSVGRRKTRSDLVEQGVADVSSSSAQLSV